MTYSIRIHAASLGLALWPTGCVGPSEQKPMTLETGPEAEITVDGLVRARGSAFAMVWIKPDADIGSYTGLIVGDVEVAYKRPPRSTGYSGSSDNNALDPRQMERLEDGLRSALTKEIEASQSWALETEPGPSVLLIESALIDLVVRVPTDLPPRSTVYTTSTAEATLVLELHDSMTRDLLARVADRRVAQEPGAGSHGLYWSNPVSNRAAMMRVFNRWARILMERLDTAQSVEASRLQEAAVGNTD